MPNLFSVYDLFLKGKVTDSITYLMLQVGIMYLGHTPFPISPRNSPIAVAHLIRKTGLRYLLVSGDAAMQRVAHEARAQLAQDGNDVSFLPLPRFAELYGGGNMPDVPKGRLDPRKPALILHSSGGSLLVFLRGESWSDFVCRRINVVPEAYHYLASHIFSMGLHVLYAGDFIHILFVSD